MMKGASLRENVLAREHAAFDLNALDWSPRGVRDLFLRLKSGTVARWEADAKNRGGFAKLQPRELNKRHHRVIDQNQGHFTCV